MPPAASLTEAVGLANQNLQNNNDGGDLQSSIENFNDAWIASFSVNLQPERTVLDWIVPLRGQQAILPTTGSFAQVADAADILCRMLYATIAAQSAGRISGAQATAVLSAYNTHIALT